MNRNRDKYASVVEFLHFEAVADEFVNATNVAHFHCRRHQCLNS